ncbi:MAG: hypothetical protein ACREOU_09435 [Candidatus Eiseniibacteriota bacterium]
MTGRLALAGAILSWGLLLATLLFGGLDPTPREATILRVLSVSALALSAAAMLVGLVALVRRRRRISAALGIAVAFALLLYFTGLGHVL